MAEKINSNSSNKDQRWNQRKRLVQAIYAHLQTNDKLNIALIADEYNLELDYIKVLEFFKKHKHEIIVNFENLMPSDWIFKSNNLVVQSILLQSVCEYFVLNTPISVLIDQAIITTKNFCDRNDYKFVNGVLESYLKKYAKSSR